MPTAATTINALRLLSGAFDLIGVKSPGESLTAADETDGLRRLNQMIRGWSIQNLTIPFTSRQVFPLVANQATYTIGIGGQLDTMRPIALEGAGLILDASMLTATMTALSVSNGTFTVASDLTAVFTPGTVFQLSGTPSNANDGIYTVVSSAFGTATVVTVAEAFFGTMAGGTLTVAATTTPRELPRAVITDEAYQAIALKALVNPLFTSVYYNATYPLGTIYLWPVPNTAAHALVLYTLSPLREFRTLVQEYEVPPGYEDALEYGIAERLLAPYAIRDQAVMGMVSDDARRTLAIIKRPNTRMSDLQNDATFAVAGRRNRYNLLTGSGG